MSRNSSRPNEHKEIAEELKVLADNHRLQIICLLRDGERCVCDIYQALKLPQNLVSHHLKVLKKAGLVENRRDGTWMRYQLTKKGGTSTYEVMLGKALKLTRVKQKERKNGD